MKKVWFLAAVFLAGLGVVIGNRMSTEAMGVVVGVVLGVAASIPMVLIILLFLARRDKKEEERRQAAYPPVIVVSGGGQPQPMRMPYLTPPANYGGDGQRTFTLIGDEDTVSIDPGRRGGIL
ncbi:MAG: hypothetical protein QHH80_13275 [Anaerolineae bacterium]|nr:hypothetical protein [Anaerolineae bacterium]